MNNKEGFIAKYKGTLKSMDTEENIDLVFYRPLGFAWALLCAKLKISPNVITIASIFLGIGAGVMFNFNNLWFNVIGMFLLIWANTFDSADGQLARMTGQFSRVGRILDGLSGDLWFVTIYFSICFREIATSDFFMAHHWVIWVLAVSTGLCHAKQAAMADYYRQFHLFFVKGKAGSELETLRVLDARYDELTWKHDAWRKVMLFFYRNYTANQEKMTPNMQRLRDVLRQKFGEEIPQSFRNDFRIMSKPLMKYTNWLSFNVRTIALFTALFLQMPWLYFAFEITVLNILLIYMWRRHENICKYFIKEISNGAY